LAPHIEGLVKSHAPIVNPPIPMDLRLVFTSTQP
jgi:hypothetical protein